jgi:hypothetical protein
MCKSFAKFNRTLWDNYVWTGKKYFSFLLAQQSQQSLAAFVAKFLNYANLTLSTISMHIMLGTCVPNLRHRGWVKHTQTHLALKNGTITFYYTRNFWGIFSEFTFALEKNPNDGYEGGGILSF